MFVRPFQSLNSASRTGTSAGAAALLAAVLAPAGLAGPPCDADGDACRDACRRPDRYACRLTVEPEPIEKECFLIEPEAICVPPIATSPFDCVRNLFCGKKGHGRGCGVNGCTTAGCDGCGAHAGGARQAGWLARLCNHGCGGGIRCVNTLDVHEYECGERCVCRWSAVPVDACGRFVVPAPASATPAPQDADDGAVPPAPAPTPLRYDLPTLEPAPTDAAEPSEPSERGVAEQALDE